jgi:hypothetical protein
MTHQERERERERNPMETIDDMTRLKMKILTKQVESHNPQLVFWMIYLLYHDYLLWESQHSDWLSGRELQPMTFQLSFH